MSAQGATRGMETSEFEARVACAQAAMARAGLAALFLTTEPDVRYFTGFLTRFWESPSRSWFVIVPAVGAPVAVIPEIGAALMRQGWIRDVRTWPAPQPEDDGVSLVIEALREVAGGGRVGVPMGYETHLRMPLADFERLRAAGIVFGDDRGILARLRAVKSEAEIARIAQACAIAGRAFQRVGEVAGAGVPLSQVFRGFQALLLEEGADWVPYLAGGAGPLGYGDVISPAHDAPLAAGDVLMLDTGAVWDGYFCDFDRNFLVGGQGDVRVIDGWSRLLEAAEAGLELARPGMRACDLWRAMATVTGDNKGGVAGVRMQGGRLGHGLGMQLTEGLSLSADDETVLEAGMVITLEPTVETAAGLLMVHEENIVIREDHAQVLSPWMKGSLPEI